MEKIFSYEIKSALKIRTKETGYDAIQASELIENSDIRQDKEETGSYRKCDMLPVSSEKNIKIS